MHAQPGASAPLAQGTASPAEMKVLSRIQNMRPGVQGAVGKLSFTVGEVYFSASGHRCRQLKILNWTTHQQTSRVACESGQEWVLTKNVYVTGAYHE